MKSALTPKAQADIERVWELRREAVQLLDQVVAEWRSDPTSVQCFDLRIVKRAGEVIDELKKRDTFGGIY